MDFLTQALIFMCAAILIVPLFQAAGFGSILGYLISGVVIGPGALALIQDTESIAHFAELGVIFLLFVIGLEIQPRKLWSMRRHLLGLGGLQVLLTTMVLGTAANAFGLPLLTAYVLGFALSLSSTAFAIQSLRERNEFNTEFGRASFSILLAQDLIAIPALALLPALVTHQTNSSYNMNVQTSLLGLGLVIALVIAARFLIRPAFRLISASRNREIFTATTLLVVLGVAFMMQQVGLSAALGTFLAGVLLAESEYRHEIEADLEPFKGLSMGLFFISVGMGVNLQVIWQKPIIVASLVVGYLILKGLCLYTVGRLARQNHVSAKNMSLSIVQGGEFAFVIFALAKNLQLASSEMLDLLTVVITLSMAASPLLLMFNDYLRTKLACGQVAQDKKFDEMVDESPEVIIVGYGRFGQIFSRILKAQGVQFVAIDHSSEQIELVRRFGTKVYYGDASRVDLLRAAGAENAKYLVLAIGNVEKSLDIGKIIRENFPRLKVFARARNRGHTFDLMDLGMYRIKRETFDSSVAFVGELLIDMGLSAERVATLMDRFRVHDEVMLKEQHKVRHDDKSFIDVSKQGVAQLAQVLNDDSTQTYINQ